jgi:hypothetical protein
MFYDVVDGIYFIEFELKDTKDTAKSASYLDTDSEGPLRVKFYDTIINFNVSIVSLLFIYLCMCQHSSSTCIWSLYLSADRIFLNLWLLLWYTW